MADSSGNYTVSGLSPDTYTIIPILPGYVFSPTKVQRTIVSSNIPGVNFSAVAVSTSLVFTPLATDNFTPNANPLNPAKWTTFTSSLFPYSALQAASGAAEVTTLQPNFSGEYYSGVPTPADQYVSITLGAWVVGNGQELDIHFRGDALGDNEYLV
jgi:hypothetical protein